MNATDLQDLIRSKLLLAITETSGYELDAVEADQLVQSEIVEAVGSVQSAAALALEKEDLAATQLFLAYTPSIGDAVPVERVPSTVAQAAAAGDPDDLDLDWSFTVRQEKTKIRSSSQEAMEALPADDDGIPSVAELEDLFDSL